MKLVLLVLALVPSVSPAQTFQIRWTEVVSINDAVIPATVSLDRPSLLTNDVQLTVMSAVSPFEPRLDNVAVGVIVVPVAPNELQTPGYVVTGFDKVAMPPTVPESGYRPGYAPDTGPGYGPPPIIGEDNLRSWGYAPYRSEGQ